MFDEHTLIFVASKIEISYKAKKVCPDRADRDRLPKNQ